MASTGKPTSDHEELPLFTSDTWGLVDFDEESDLVTHQKEAWLQQKQAAFEEQCVKKVLAFCGAQDHIVDIRARSRELHGKPVVNFHWFRVIAPDFPVYLGARDVFKAHEINFQDLEKRFTTTAIFKAFEEVVREREHEERGPTALLYRSRSVLMALHDAATALDHPGFRIVRTLARGQIYVIETMKQFLENLVWTPAD